MSSPIELVRGQRTKLADLTAETRLRLSVGLEGPDAEDVTYLALLLNEAGEAVSPTAVVSSDRPNSEDGAIILQARSGLDQSFEVDLRRVAGSVASVVVALAFQTAGRRNVSQKTAQSIKAGRFEVEASGAAVARYTFSQRDLGEETAVLLGEIYRKNGVWRVRAIGEGFAGGLGSMLSRYKVSAPAVTGSGGAGIPIAAAPSVIWPPRTWPGDRQPTIPKDLVHAVGLVLCRGADGTAHSGTGFMISPGGFFVTCHHVVHDATEIMISLEGTRMLRKAEIVAMDSDSDLALCVITDRNGAPHWLMLAPPDSSSSLGDDLGLLGYPLSSDLGINVTYSQGIINSLRKRNDVPVLQIDVGAAPGSSGGPVFQRSNGLVVAVLSSGLHMGDRGMLINFAVDIRNIWRLGWLQRIAQAEGS